MRTSTKTDAARCATRSSTCGFTSARGFTGACGFTGARGFTIVELLVVILLIGVALGISLTVDFSTSPQQQKQQTTLLANALELASQEAVLDGNILGLDFFTTADALGYRWLRLQGDDEWRPLTMDGLSETRLARELSVTLTLAGQEHVPELRVDLDSTAPFAPEVVLLP
ncbi:MAG: prepilin-type N-terminal cleavage/methylation domain-containing protein, partial [Pseudomonadota bacterium]|nr:prepilin-type N-terminal cleavage/methylation domain-containing protein [Pseudomonadota bacterium]